MALGTPGAVLLTADRKYFDRARHPGQLAWLLDVAIEKNYRSPNWIIMTASFEFDVFLTHNAKDKPRVRQIADFLKRAGLRVWFDEWNIEYSDINFERIKEGLEQSRALVLCISMNALDSGWMALERGTALHRDPANEGRRFIPLVLDECELPDTLRRYKFIDFRDNVEDAENELINACRPTADKTSPAAYGKRTLSNGLLPSEASIKTSKIKTASTGRAKKIHSKPKQKNQTNQNGSSTVLEKKFNAHQGWVMGLAINRDGKWAVSGSEDETLLIWDMETGKPRTRIEANQDMTPAVAITPDDKEVLSGDKEFYVNIWDSATGLKIARLQGHKNRIWSIVTLQGKNQAISAGWDNSLKLWDIDTRNCIASAQCDPEGDNNIFSCAVDPTGSIALSGHRNGKIRFWNLETMECMTILSGHSDIVTAIRIMPNGRFAVSCSFDKTLKIWNLEEKRCTGTLEGHKNHVNGVAFSQDNSLIASTGFTDHSIKIWDPASGVCLETIDTKSSNPISIDFDPTGTRLVAGDSKGDIYLFRLSTARSIPALDAPRRYVNAKVVLLGEGTVGKTSLAHRLVDDEYVVRDRTHGMNVWRLDLPLTPSATLEREALLWDLAGQEDYRLIHQLFLEETALALLLINPQQDDPFSETGEWLKALKTAVSIHHPERSVSKLAIFSQIDTGGMKLSNNKIERFLEQNGFSAWLVTSAKTGENCSDKKNSGNPSRLKQLIAQSIPWDKLPWTSTPRLLAELKNAVVAMRDKQDIRLLRFAELVQRLEQALPGESFSESDVRTAVTLLANHGLARKLKFGDLVLLQPELLNGYASAIIRAARTHTDEIGCVLESDIYKQKFDFTGVERLKHRPDEELLLRALVQTFLDQSLCIAEDTPQGRHLVFPSQYRREKDLPRDPNVFVSYTFSGEWQTVWTTLIVRLWYSQEFEHRELWRNAAEFASSKGHTLGLKINKRQSEGTATISLYFDREVPDELKVIFIGYTHRHLAKYGQDISRDRRYVCQECGKPVLDLDTIRERLAAKKSFITCQGCDKPVPLIDFIEQRLKSDPVARKILAMDEIATRQLDTQALEQILIGHMLAITGEANQIFRPVTMFDHGIDGEVEFKDDDGKASGKRIYIQLKSGNSYLRTRKSDGREVFDIANERHLEYWINQPEDVYLVIRQTDNVTGGHVIRWMNVTRYLKQRADKKSRQIVFSGEKLDMEAIWKVRDGFFRPTLS